MKILMSCIICVFLCNTMSHAALFTFDELDPLTHPIDISTYMSDIYGAEGLIFNFSAPISKLFFISGNNSHVGIDKMSVTPMPEPAIILLLGFGLIGITTYSRRKFKK